MLWTTLISTLFVTPIAAGLCRSLPSPAPAWPLRPRAWSVLAACLWWSRLPRPQRRSASRSRCDMHQARMRGHHAMHALCVDFGEALSATNGWWAPRLMWPPALMAPMHLILGSPSSSQPLVLPIVKGRHESAPSMQAAAGSALRSGHTLPCSTVSLLHLPESHKPPLIQPHPFPPHLAPVHTRWTLTSPLAWCWVSPLLLAAVWS